MKHPLIIGAGGVASYLLPVLLKTFKPAKLTIIDKDVLEERNLDRQMFDEEQIGESKAAALAEMHTRMLPKLKPVVIKQWFDEATVIPEDVDTIFCCADNHKARHAAMNVANERNIYAYIGGNEYVDSQALVFHRSFRGTDKDLLRKYPTIATDETGSPFRCTGEAQEAAPQLAMANMHCAAKLLHLAWVYERWLPTLKIGPAERADINKSLPVEFYSALTLNDSSTAFAAPGTK